MGGLVTFAPRPASRLLDIVHENQEVNVEEAINISELQQPTSLFFYKAFILLLKLLLFFLMIRLLYLASAVTPDPSASASQV